MSDAKTNAPAPGRFRSLVNWWTSPSPVLRPAEAPLSAKRLALIVAGLALLTVLPRAIVAMRLVAVCNDAYYYGWVAEMFSRGEFEKPLTYLNVNVYPLILWSLKSLGFDPLVAGKWWGVAASGMTVIPLFFLLRRLLDDRVAIAGCVLFAIHPELIEIAVEPIREATFWLFLVSALLLIHLTAERPGRWLCTIGAGVAFALAVHTRTEGWALLIPIFVWMVWKPSRPEFRHKLRMNAIVMLAMIPLFLAAVNFTVLRTHDRFEWGRFTAARNLVEWIAGVESDEKATQPPPVTTGSAAPSLSLAGRTVLFFREAGEEFEYINLCLLLLGAMTARSRIFSRELLPIALIFGGQMFAVWVRLIQVGNINGRYFLTAYVMALPTIACGGLYLLAAMRRVGERRGHGATRYRITAGVAVSLVVGMFWFDAIDSPHESRAHAVALGRALQRRHGRPRYVETDLHSTRIGYEAAAKFPWVGEYHGVDESDRPLPDMIIVRTPSIPRFQGRIEQAGLVPLETLPGEPHRRDADYRVFVRPRIASVRGRSKIE